MGARLISLNLFLYYPSPCSSSSPWTFLLLLEHHDHFPDSAPPIAQKVPFSPLAIADSLSTFRIQFTGTSSDASYIAPSCLFPLWSEVKWSESHSVVSDSFWPHWLYSPWDSPGQNIGVGSLSLLQGIFPAKGSNPGLPHCRQILYQLSHHGSPRILEWVAYPFSSWSSWPRNQTGISCIAGGFFTSWASRKPYFFCNLI